MAMLIWLVALKRREAGSRFAANIVIGRQTQIGGSQEAILEGS